MYLVNPISCNMAGMEYVPPTKRQFDYLLRGRLGGGLGHINTIDFRLRKGGGFFSVLGKIAKNAIPFILPAAAKMGKQVISDLTQGEGLKSSLKKRGIESIQEGLMQITNPGKRKVGINTTKNHKKKKNKNKKKKKKFMKVSDLKEDVFAMM